MLNVGEIIAKRLRNENEEREKKHTPSGKLSASTLGYPVQWQILKYLGAKTKEHDDYTLAKFRRGVHVEDFIVDTLQLNDPKIKEQVKCEYRNAIGYLDIFTSEGYPIEVKSVTNRAFTWIKKDGAKDGHILQGAYYALALKKPRFSVLYVASDDYRTQMFDFQTKAFETKIDNIITEFNKIVERKEIPQFKAIEKWQENEKYNPYPEWMNLDQATLAKRAEILYSRKAKEENES